MCVCIKLIKESLIYYKPKTIKKRTESTLDHTVLNASGSNLVIEL